MCYIEILHKITNRNTINTSLLPCSNKNCNTPVIGYISTHNHQLTLYKYMLNKNSLAVKKVRGQSEATMAISDQNL